MYKKIIIPIEKENDSELMVYYASKFLKKGGIMVPIHIIDTKKAPEVMRRWRNSVNIILPTYETGAELGITVEPHVRSAKTIPDGILELVDEVSADSIFMLLKNVKYTNKLFFTTVIDSVLRYSKVDVLVTNRLALISKKSNEKLLIPFIGNKPPERLLKFAKNFTDKNGGSIVLININVKNSKNGGVGKNIVKGMKYFVKQIILAPYNIVNSKTVVDAIMKEVKKENYGTILISEDIFGGKYIISHVKVLDYLAKKAPCPVLFLKR